MSDTINKPPSSTILLITGENYQPDMSLLKASSIGTVERTVKVPISNDEALSEGRLASTIRRDAEEQEESLKEYVKEQKARIAEMRREAAEHQEVCDTGEREVVMKVWVVPSKKPGQVEEWREDGKLHQTRAMTAAERQGELFGKGDEE